MIEYVICSADGTELARIKMEPDLGRGELVYSVQHIRGVRSSISSRAMLTSVLDAFREKGAKITRSTPT